jgi:DNA phosphorothioation-associated putative methyltransferase
VGVILIGHGAPWEERSNLIAHFKRTWTEARERRVQDVLVYLALSRFPNRCKFSDLPESTRLDIRAFFGTYSRACEQADVLLFSAGKPEAINNACSSSPVGKITPDALYLHESALGDLPPLLRVYEGCARVLVGRVEGGNIIKLHRTKPAVSYLSYPEFETVAHPPLCGSLKVDLQKLRVKYLDYAGSENRPILHRKEQFISSTNPSHSKFARSTRQEERKKLFDDPNLIGYERFWQDLIQSRGLRIVGHRLMRRMDGQKGAIEDASLAAAI